MKIIFIIPARGSNQLKQEFKKLNNKPLLYYNNFSIKSNKFSNIIVTSDSKILDYSKKLILHYIKDQKIQEIIVLRRYYKRSN